VAASFSAPTFVTIIDLNRLEVWAYVDETDIGRIEVGQQAEFTVDTYTDINFIGKVTAVYPKAEIQDNVVNYITIVEIIDNKDKVIRPEMTTTVTINVASRKDVLAVPNSAVRNENGQKVVYVLEQNQPVKRQVRAGWRDRNYTEITEGIEAGETVILGDVNLLP
jgi:macrolide-specific efflux system membrane fusion protein